MYKGMSTFQGTRACEQAVRLNDAVWLDAGWDTSTAHTDDGPTDGGGGN